MPSATLVRRINADNPYEEGSAREALPGAPGDVHSIFHQRAIHHGEKHALQDELISTYNGDIPSQYMDMFHEEQRAHIINMLRLSADDLGGMAGQELPLYFPSEDDTPAKKKKAEKREYVCYGYNSAGQRNGGVNMAGLMHVQGHNLVLCGEAVAMVLPDHVRKTPYFTYRDPRTHFAPIGWSPWSQGDLDGTMFAYQLTLAEAKQRWPEAAGELNVAYTKRTFGSNTGWNPTTYMRPAGYGGHLDEESIYLWIGEYYNKDAWYVCTLEDHVVTLLASESGDRGHPDVCPVVGFAPYNLEDPRSLLADQISLQVAQSRMFSQQLDYFDRSLYPPLFGTKLVGDKVRYGPGAYNTFDPGMQEKPVFFQAAPPNPVQADQMMQFGMVLLRMLNRNPEAFQGGGDANSAKAISELKGSVSSTVTQNLWPTFFQGIPQLYAKAMRMDINLWGDIEKSISGVTPSNHRRLRSTSVGVTYRPRVALAGYEDQAEIEPGIMLKGYTGRLELMQLKGAGGLSLDTFLEQLDVVRDPEAEKRRIQSDKWEEVIIQDLLAKAGEGRLVPGAFAALREKVLKGTDFFDAVKELEDAHALYVEAPSPEQAPPGGAPEGSPEAIAQMAQSLGAGGVPGQSEAPALELIRGGGRAA